MMTEGAAVIGFGVGMLCMWLYTRDVTRTALSARDKNSGLVEATLKTNALLSRELAMSGKAKPARAFVHEVESYQNEKGTVTTGSACVFHGSPAGFELKNVRVPNGTEPGAELYVWVAWDDPGDLNSEDVN